MDLARIGHIGAEVAVIGGVAFALMQQNKGLQAEVEELRKQLQHVALHTRNIHEEHEGRIASLTLDLEKLRKGRERPPVRNREVLRVTPINDEVTPVPVRTRSRKLPILESPVTVEGEEDEESDPEAVLKRM